MKWCDLQAWLLNLLRRDWYLDLVDATSAGPAPACTREEITPLNETPWKISSHGIVLHLFNEHLKKHSEPADACLLFIPPGSCTGKHRHLAEECLYVVEGRGHILYQDCDIEITDTYHWKVQEDIKRYDCGRGDLFYLPPNTPHQYFNDDLKRPMRLLTATTCIRQKLGLNDVEQLESAPEYTSNVLNTLDQNSLQHGRQNYVSLIG